MEERKSQPLLGHTNSNFYGAPLQHQELRAGLQLTTPRIRMRDSWGPRQRGFVSCKTYFGTTKVMPGYLPCPSVFFNVNSCHLTAHVVAAGEKALLLFLVVLDLALFLHPIFQACGIDFEDLIPLFLKDSIAGQLLALLVFGS